MAAPLDINNDVDEDGIHFQKIAHEMAKEENTKIMDAIEQYPAHEDVVKRMKEGTDDEKVLVITIEGKYLEYQNFKAEVMAFHKATWPLSRSRFQLRAINYVHTPRSSSALAFMKFFLARATMAAWLEFEDPDPTKKNLERYNRARFMSDKANMLLLGQDILDDVQTVDVYSKPPEAEAS
ncbi:MAG: hypothetical protein Q9222_002978 [Ikaeria aurantiellina]